MKTSPSLATLESDNHQNDAAFIVHACNEHIKLIEIINKVRQEIDGYIDGSPDCSSASRLANRIAKALEEMNP